MRLGRRTSFAGFLSISRGWPPSSVTHEGYCYEGSACATVKPRRVPHGTSGTNSPYGRRSWKCRITAHSVRGIEIASASPAHALRGARNQPRFEASSAWIFRPSYHRQDCALRRTLIATLIERDSTGPTCNEFNCAVPRMFYLVIRQTTCKQGQ